MDEILREWEFPEEIIKTFQDHKLEKDQINELLRDDFSLKELIPAIGLRLKFKSKWAEINEQQSTCNATTVTLSSDSFSVTEPTTSDNQTITVTEDTPFIIWTGPQYEDFCLKTLLTTTALGKSILTYYNTFHKLDNTRRNRLCSIIVKHLYNYIIKNRLSQEEYNSLAAKIVTLFPAETTGTYYVPPVKKVNSPFGKSQMAKGKLVNQVKNILFRSGDTVKRKTDNDEDNEHRVPEKTITSDPDAYNEDILWLSHNQEPWNTVIEKWKNTFAVRAESIYDNLSVTQYIDKWPILLDLRSSVLINLDFERKYPNSNIGFWQNWETFFERILLRKKDEVKEPLAREYIETLSGLSEGDNKFPLQVAILNYMFPPKGRIRVKNKGHWKFSTIESFEGMIKLVKNTGDLEKEIEAIINKAYERNCTIQPFLMLDGLNLYTVRNCYLVVNHKLRYQFTSVSEGFDTLFKIFHTINIKYPPQCQHLYQLIQKCVYKIHTPYDIVFPELVDIENMFK